MLNALIFDIVAAAHRSCQNIFLSFQVPASMLVYCVKHGQKKYRQDERKQHEI